MFYPETKAMQGFGNGERVMTEVHTAICRFCHAFCGVKVTVENGKAVRVIGDKDNPLYFGYSCVKGCQLPRQHAHPDRVIHPQKRGENGHRRITSNLVLDDTDHGGYQAAVTFSHRLVSRRMNDVYNASGRDIPVLVRNHTCNPAFMNPGDLAAMSHAFGDTPENEAQVFVTGSNTGRLTNVERDYDLRTGMPRMSAIPVNIKRADQSIAAG